MKTNYFIGIFLVFGFFLAKSQEQQKINPKKEARKNRPVFLQLSGGMGKLTFRDFATSPLFYEGVLFHTGIERKKFDAIRYATMGTNFGFGLSTGKTDKSAAGLASLFNFHFFYQQLYQINRNANNKWNFKVGGNFNSNFNGRLNSSLNNNGFGFELFASLMASGRITYDLSNQKEKRIPLYIFTYKIPPKKRFLFYELNIGVLNTNFRNGFAYITNASILNSDNPFNLYEFKFFDGIQGAATIGYTVYLPNGNGLELAYEWRFQNTSSETEKFEMLIQTLKFSLLFNYKSGKK